MDGLYEVRQHTTGEYYAVSNAEPYFCFWAKTREEAIEKAQAAIIDFNENVKGDNEPIKEFLTERVHAQ